MKQLTYREIICEGCQEVEVIDPLHPFDLNHFAQSCGQNPQWILQLLEFDILPTRRQSHASSNQYYFLPEDIARAQRAYRLQRDFDASLSAVALMIEMIDELHSLRQHLR